MSQIQRSSTSSYAALPLKDALRMVRYTMRRSRSYLGRPPVPLPTPINDLAQSVLSGIDTIATDVNEVAADIAHRYLDMADDRGSSAPDFRGVAEGQWSKVLFAETAYKGLTRAFDYLGVPAALVSEVRAADAYQAVMRRAGDTDETAERAADLMAEMLQRDVVWSVTPEAPDDRDAPALDEMPAVAVFALMLWLITERDGSAEEEEALLLTCCDLANVVRDEVLACQGDRNCLTALFVENGARI